MHDTITLPKEICFGVFFQLSYYTTSLTKEWALIILKQSKRYHDKLTIKQERCCHERLRHITSINFY